MRAKFIGLILGATLFAGCSKNDATVETTGQDTGAAAATPASPDPMVEAAMSDIGKKLEAKQFESAIGAMAIVGSMPKSPEQQMDFLKQVRQANDAMSASAAAGDQAAMAHRQMLGRMLTGR